MHREQYSRTYTHDDAESKHAEMQNQTCRNECSRVTRTKTIIAPEYAERNLSNCEMDRESGGFAIPNTKSADNIL